MVYSDVLRADVLLVVSLYVGTTTLTKSALRYVDMPTQTVLKSAKLIPVMVGSLFIVGRAFAAHEWLAAVMLVSGICVFSLSNGGERTAHDGQHDSILGVGCVLLALVCDALLGNFQQQVLYLFICLFIFISLFYLLPAAGPLF